MLIVETPVFTRQVLAALSDDDYRGLQLALVMNPERGVVIRGSGGLRKVRWGAEGRGKRGGVRTIYSYAPRQQVIVMLFLFAKNEQEDLTPEQLRRLRAVVEHEFETRVPV
ncbi:type II toxin-antitoxin system RelE/ParE family toxin [Longimicrobium sp.]|uniref:type II toxin-antitoxin system RelE/ParE family toxin n=1 Tax=Longimicrobium sp. TaxID=2029185 RepID=UPI002D002197|nr:type II toxin-antitoxin system RelE/ParE family toxin [Longimicrobium sp.]HSU15040.1 type II toxin-antitoxin system RelE/ParE family toxin [Longimicrobium sp.]